MAKGFTQGVEAELGLLLRGDYRRGEGPNERFDFESVDDPKRVVELKAGLRSVRDLHGAILQVAKLVRERDDIERATLIVQMSSLGEARLRDEWQEVMATLHPEVSRRLALVAIAGGGDVVLPARDADLGRLLALAREAFNKAPQRADDLGPAMVWSQRSYGVWRVLLDGWLRGEPPLTLQEIGRRAGASAPTVRGTIEHLIAIGDIERSRHRGVTLRGMPRRSLNELSVAANRFRRTTYFVNSGRGLKAEALVKRVDTIAPQDVAIGGVVAARHYDSNLDLNGLPRIDLTVPGKSSVEWIERIDPALQPGVRGDSSGILVLHRNLEAASGFEAHSAFRHPVSGPTEALLDLLDMRLVDQAHSFMRSMRARNEGTHA